jgi:hypothetical protein
LNYKKIQHLELFNPSEELHVKYWNVNLVIARELSFYQYPFRFPNFFAKYRNKYDFEVKLEILKVFSTVYCVTSILLLVIMTGYRFTG